MKIRFLQDRLVKDETNKLFKKDEVCELSEASCAHWISRGVAVEVEPKTKVGPSKVETATVTAPETTRSVNVPLPDKPGRPPSPLTQKDALGKGGGK